jgi:hypothetical protein
MEERSEPSLRDERSGAGKRVTEERSTIPTASGQLTHAIATTPRKHENTKPRKRQNTKQIPGVSLS